MKSRMNLIACSLRMAILGSMLLGSAAQAEVTCRVVGVSDGDTITCLTKDMLQLKLRLAEIDAPEKKQPFGQRSKQSLSEMVFGRDIVVKEKGQDRYQRTLAAVYLEGVNINLEQVRRGMAWCYRKYLSDEQCLDIEAQAKSTETGLWQDSGPVPPWDWRKKGRGSE